MTIQYSISIDNPDAHVINVIMQIDGATPDGQQLQLPNWIPGSYMIRDFSRHVISFTAHGNDQQPIPVHKLDKSTWALPAGLHQVTVRYQVYAWDLSVRTAHVDRNHAFFNGTSVFLCAVGSEHVAHRVEFVPPSNTDFRLATTLTVDHVDNNGFGFYQARDYADLIDHPVEMGAFKQISFEACAVPHRVVLTGACHFDEQRLARDLQVICEYQIRFFGEPAPFEQYLFLVMVVDKGYGGLEHRSSTALMITRDQLPIPDSEHTDDSYLDFLSLCSHEYFHTWNVKRIKPARFIPYYLQSEVYTDLLWFFEGVTSYYDDIMLVRSGLIDGESYLKLLEKTMSRVHRGTGRYKQTVAESSFDAWHKFYKQDENAANAIVSYYQKGALLALCLDSRMRVNSDNKTSLDSLMVEFWNRWKDNSEGLKEDEPQHIASRLISSNLDDFFNRYLYGTDELPMVESLSHFGVALSWRPRQSQKDTGGLLVDDALIKKQAWFGASYVDAPGGVKISHVANDSPAEKAGIAPGDLLVAMAGLSLTAQDIDRRLQRYVDQTDIELHYFRLGQLYCTVMPIRLQPLDTAQLKITDAQALAAWLRPEGVV